MSSQERVAVFIDGANLYAATRNLEFDIDYRKLLTEFKAGAVWSVPSIIQSLSRMMTIHQCGPCWIGWTTMASLS